MAVLFDIQGVQSKAHGERGIARYLLELARALERERPGAVSTYLLNPDLPLPGTIEPIAESGRIDFSDRVDFGSASVYHVGSLFEYEPIDRLWPDAAERAGLRFAVTLYDLIPEIYSDVYLSDPLTRTRYRTRLAMLRRADRVLTISEATARDATELLRISPDRIRVAGTGVSAHFVRPVSRAAAEAEVRERMPLVRPGFVLYTGGIDHRKNIDRLLEAYAALPARLRARHQLIVVCRVQPAEAAALDRRLEELGVSADVHFPGFVPDEELVLLYQAARLFVFPSLYEGFGLPLAEAIACGAPALAARTSSLVELVDDEAALFEPTDPRSIRDAIENALEDEELLRRLSEKQLHQRHTWAEVARRTASAYDELRGGTRHRVGRSRRVALVSPLPPQASGIAEYSGRLVEHLVRFCPIDAFVDAPVTTPPGVTVMRIGGLERIARIERGYRKIVYCLGNSEFHAEALALLRRQPGVVIAHDVRLTGLYAWSAHYRPELQPWSFHQALQSMYGARVPATLGMHGHVSGEEADRYALLMAQETIAHSERYLVHSAYAAQLARLDARAGDVGKIGVIPFAFPDPDNFAADPTPRSDTPVVASYGISAPEKQTEKVIEAFVHVTEDVPDARLVIAGRPAAPELGKRYRALCKALGLSERVTLTGQLDDASYRAWLRRATVAVQLRAASNGESSAAVADCLAAGTPAIVTDVGWARELPDDSVIKVERSISAKALADRIVELLGDEARRATQSASGIEHARQNSFARTAEFLRREVLEAD